MRKTLPDDLTQPRPAWISSEGMQLPDIQRKAFDKICEFPDNDWNQQDYQNRYSDNYDGKDEKGCNQAIQSSMLDLLRERI
jgi:hypothetical protein